MLQHVTHCDADALGCALLAGPAAIRFCDYQSVDEVVTQTLEVATVSLYASKGDVNVGEIAKAHGGGGHIGAAGFPYGLRELTENLVAAKLSGQLEVHAKRKAE